MFTKALHLHCNNCKISIYHSDISNVQQGRPRYLLANVDTNEQSTMQTMHLPLLITNDMGPNKTFLAPFLLWQRSIFLWTIERNVHVVRKESLLAQHVQRLLHQIRVHHFILRIRRDFHDDMNGLLRSQCKLQGGVQGIPTI